MANYKSELCNPFTGYRPPITNSSAGEVVAVRGTYAVPAAGLALNDIVEMVPLPPDAVVVDCVLDCDDLDSDATPLMTLAVGVVKEDGTDIESSGTLISANVAPKAGGIARLDTPGAYAVGSSESKRNVGVKVTAAPATPKAGNIGLTLMYRNAQQGE